MRRCFVLPLIIAAFAGGDVFASLPGIGSPVWAEVNSIAHDCPGYCALLRQYVDEINQGDYDFDPAKDSLKQYQDSINQRDFDPFHYANVCVWLMEGNDCRECVDSIEQYIESFQYADLGYNREILPTIIDALWYLDCNHPEEHFAKNREAVITYLQRCGRLYPDDFQMILHLKDCRGEDTYSLYTECLLSEEKEMTDYVGRKAATLYLETYPERVPLDMKKKLNERWGLGLTFSDAGQTVSGDSDASSPAVKNTGVIESSKTEEDKSSGLPSALLKCAGILFGFLLIVFFLLKFRRTKTIDN